MIVSLEEMKRYLRVDYSEEDGLIEQLLASAERLCMDVARLTEEQWSVIDSDAEESEEYSKEELKGIRAAVKVAVLYAVGYLFEHREDADHHELLLTLRAMLFAIREGAGI
jgi:uncharacterized phage protein (predicted DNA packaging)